MSEEIPQWAQQLIADVGDLKEQVLTNCAKLDGMKNTIDTMKENTDLIPQVLEIVQANGENNEELSKE